MCRNYRWIVASGNVEDMIAASLCRRVRAPLPYPLLRQSTLRGAAKSSFVVTCTDSHLPQRQTEGGSDGGPDVRDAIVANVGPPGSI